jgi:hypothetical protein
VLCSALTLLGLMRDIDSGHAESANRAERGGGVDRDFASIPHSDLLHSTSKSERTRKVGVTRCVRCCSR